ncbi:MAG TPA: type VII secretion target [Actinophytocola sp.]|uniref:type VII secretion target n=1 Tax=Actinophytocola sp. TaxID=1872138 RepID=UPI002DB567F1|nr:type VII secretion target [Actinophytocola sp.]HEU5473982.1 type VII secretion target [Actinophytocola sp.]
MDAQQISQAVGYSIAADELTGYVRHTRQLAEELTRLARRRIATVREITEDSFGRIGRETGFTAALNRFAGALEHQVGGIAGNADKLSDGVAKTARNYRRQDQELAEDLLNLLD